MPRSFDVGFCSGRLSSETLLDSFLVDWGLGGLRHNSFFFDKVMEGNVAYSPLYARYLSVAEFDNPNGGIPIVSSEVVRHIMEGGQAREIHRQGYLATEVCWQRNVRKVVGGPHPECLVPYVYVSAWSYVRPCTLPVLLSQGGNPQNAHTSRCIFYANYLLCIQIPRN